MFPLAFAFRFREFSFDSTQKCHMGAEHVRLALTPAAVRVQKSLRDRPGPATAVAGRRPPGAAGSPLNPQSVKTERRPAAGGRVGDTELEKLRKWDSWVCASKASRTSAGSASPAVGPAAARPSRPHAATCADHGSRAVKRISFSRRLRVGQHAAAAQPGRRHAGATPEPPNPAPPPEHRPGRRFASNGGLGRLRVSTSESARSQAPRHGSNR